LVSWGVGLKKWVFRPEDTEEVSFQAHGILKSQVVKPVSNFSLGERIVGN
jgi:hypothetical protein